MAYESRETKDTEHWMKMKKEALKKHASGERLTLEETAVAIWDPETEKNPMTCMGVLKIEKRALAKLKLALRKYGIKNLDDIFEPKYREFGHPVVPDSVWPN